MVLVDGIALKRGHVRAGERCEIAGVGPVDVDWVRRLLPDAIVDVLVHDGVDITTYASATRAIRKAVRLAVGHPRRVLHRARLSANAAAPNTDHRRRLRQRRARLHRQPQRPLHLPPQPEDPTTAPDWNAIDDHWHWYPPGHTQPWISPVGANLTLWDTDSS